MFILRITHYQPHLVNVKYEAQDLYRRCGGLWQHWCTYSGKSCSSATSSKPSNAYWLQKQPKWLGNPGVGDNPDDRRWPLCNTLEPLKVKYLLCVMSTEIVVWTWIVGLSEFCLQQQQLYTLDLFFNTGHTYLGSIWYICLWDDRPFCILDCMSPARHRWHTKCSKCCRCCFRSTKETVHWLSWSSANRRGNHTGWLVCISPCISIQLLSCVLMVFDVDVFSI